MTQSLVEDHGRYEESWICSLEDFKANLKREMAELSRKLGDAENRLEETAAGLSDARQQVILHSFDDVIIMIQVCVFSDLQRSNACPERSVSKCTAQSSR